MDNEIYHVYPLKDLHPHNLDGVECDCNPKIEDYENGGTVVIHNAFDGRELMEQAKAGLENKN